MTEGRVSGFIKLPRELVRSETWQRLSLGARALLIEIWSFHNGRNNGAIGYSVRQAVASLGCSFSTAKRWFKELQDARLIEAEERGGFRWKTGAKEGRATAWRIIPERNPRAK